MDYRKRVRLSCKDCKWYEIIKSVQRCTVKSNMDHNWVGVIYKQHPDWKNYNKICEDYEKGEKDEKI